MSDVYSKPYKPSKMESFAETVNGFYIKLLLQNASSSILDKVLNTRQDVFFFHVFNSIIIKIFRK